ncbi:MAG: GNAT family N-acetyltransferase [Prevotellaceae bacterium]|jgi:ribosomal protein S18 acetylase RimI-like enzyme|nr:GNAT family N-acetyltransferase [Prevotellaceae bacterium]
MIQVKQITTRNELKAFVRFPHKLFKGNEFWVPPLDRDELFTLDKDKNPAFEHCISEYWLAYKDGELAGRIAGIINYTANEKWGKKVRFGWIDFIEDAEVAKALLNAVETWGRELGMESIQGPLGFNDMDNEGMLVDGFDKLPTIANIYNYPYYPVFMEKIGYNPEEDWVQFKFNASQPIPEKMDRINRLIAEKYKLRIIMTDKKKELVKYTHSLFKTLNASFSNLYGYSTLTENEIKTIIKNYFTFINPKLVCLIVDENDEVVGFGISMPSLSRAFQKAKGKLFPFGFIHILKALNKTDEIDLYLNGVHPDWQKRGIHSLYYVEMNKAYIRNNVKTAISNQQLESNTAAVSAWDIYEKEQYIRRRCYTKKLTD